MRRDREPFYEAPDQRPQPPSRKELTGSTEQKGYRVVARAERGAARRYIAQRDFSDGPYTGEQFSDR